MPALTWPDPTPGGALSGVRVLDLTTYLPGPYATLLLADLGADVIRVEPPGGAHSRCLPPFHDGRSLYFAYRNSNKRGIVLDLEEQGGRERLVDLAGRADVFIESFAPGTLAERGLAPTTLVERHPHLVALSARHAGLRGDVPREAGRFVPYGERDGATVWMGTSSH